MRERTPLLYYLSPSVVYYGEVASFYVDPKDQSYLVSGEFPFIEARIDGYVLDYDGYVDETTSFSNGAIN